VDVPALQAVLVAQGVHLRTTQVSAEVAA
jgi:hypothetical protein